VLKAALRRLLSAESVFSPGFEAKENSAEARHGRLMCGASLPLAAGARIGYTSFNRDSSILLAWAGGVCYFSLASGWATTAFPGKRVQQPAPGRHGRSGMPQVNRRRRRLSRDRYAPIRKSIESLESRILLSFSNANLNGPWTLAGMNTTGTVVFDGAGNAVGGSFTHADGSTNTPSGTYSVGANGAVTIFGSPIDTGAMNTTKDVFAISDTTNQNSLGLVVNSSSANFSNADLTGTWYLFTNGDSGPPDDPSNGIFDDNSAHGTLTFDGVGGFTGTSVADESGTSQAVSGTYSVSPGGAVVISPTNATNTFTGAMNNSKDLVAADATNLPQAATLNNSRMGVLVRALGAYSAADLNGTWTLCSDNGQGSVTFDGAGNFSATINNNSGTVETTIGTYVISQNGAVNVSGNTTSSNGSQSTVNSSGVLNTARNLLILDNTNSGQKGLDDLTVLVGSSVSSQTTTSVQTSSNLVTPGQQVTLTTSVTSSQPAAGTPTGNVTFLDGGATLAVAGLQPDGTATFSTTALSAGFHNITVAYGGGAGFSPSNSTTADVLVAVQETVGQLDPTFGVGGLASHAIGFSGTSGVALQPDGKSVIAGTIGSPGSDLFGLTRYNADGSVDTAFGANGVVVTGFGDTDDVSSAVTLLPGGQIVVAGTATTLVNDQSTGSEFAIAEYNADGSPDTGFGNGSGQELISFSATPGALSSDVLHAMATTPGGLIYLAGQSNAGVGTGLDFAVAELNADGSPVGGFGNNGRALLDLGGNDSINAIVVQSNGELVAAGSTQNSISGVASIAMVRLTPAGTLDPTFGNKGTVITSVRGVDDEASSLALTSDGKIWLGGTSATGSSADGTLTSDFVVARYTKVGKIDPSFGHGPVIASFGQPAALTQILVRPDGELVASGKTTASLSGLNPGALDLALVRYTSTGVPDPTFNGTGKAIVNLAAATPSFHVLALSNFDTTSDLMQAFDQLTQSSQGAVAMTQGGELLDVGNNASNTVEAGIITSGVDLVARVTSGLPGVAVGGNKGIAQVQVTESGTSRATGNVSVQLQFSPSSQGLTGGSELQTFSERVNLRSGASQVFKISFHFAAGLPDDQYFLLAIVSGASLNDLNPADGIAVSSSTVHLEPQTISLSASNLAASSTFTPGAAAKIAFVVKNLGNVDANGTVLVQLLISPDQTQSDGTVVGTESVPLRLHASAVHPFRFTVTIPSGVAPGNYFLLALVDPNNTLGAFDSSDNLVVGSTITVAAK
jgi:uncharacterized delta-60 repeat protein